MAKIVSVSLFLSDNINDGTAHSVVLTKIDLLYLFWSNKGKKSKSKVSFGLFLLYQEKYRLMITELENRISFLPISTSAVKIGTNDFRYFCPLSLAIFVVNMGSEKRFWRLLDVRLNPWLPVSATFQYRTYGFSPVLKKITTHSTQSS